MAFKLQLTLLVGCLCLSSLVSGQPTPAAQEQTAPTTVPSEPSQTVNSSTPGTNESSSSTTSTAPTVTPTETHQIVNGSAFTCFNRLVGYYADVGQDCKVYHFCFPGEYHHQILYQRISYLCLNDTIFDQQALDCVESSKLTAPCDQSEKFYEASNQVLRQALVSKPSQDMGPSNSTSTESTAN